MRAAAVAWLAVLAVLAAAAAAAVTLAAALPAPSHSLLLTPHESAARAPSVRGDGGGDDDGPPTFRPVETFFFVSPLMEVVTLGSDSLIDYNGFVADLVNTVRQTSDAPNSGILHARVLQPLAVKPERGVVPAVSTHNVTVYRIFDSLAAYHNRSFRVEDMPFPVLLAHVTFVTYATPSCKYCSRSHWARYGVPGAAPTPLMLSRVYHPLRSTLPLEPLMRGVLDALWALDGTLDVVGAHKFETPNATTMFFAPDTHLQVATFASPDDVYWHMMLLNSTVFESNQLELDGQMPGLAEHVWWHLILYASDSCAQCDLNEPFPRAAAIAIAIAFALAIGVPGGALLGCGLRGRKCRNPCRPRERFTYDPWGPYERVLR